MKLHVNTKVFKRSLGFTWTELVVSLAIIFILVGVFAPALSRPPHHGAPRIKCVNNLKNVGLAFRIWATDNNDSFPLTNFNTWPIDSKSIPLLWSSLSNELSTPKLLVCPSDAKRNPADFFNNLTTKNTSYFVNIDAEETLPMNFLAGDRNVAGIQQTNSLMVLQTNSTSLFWTDDIHKKHGNTAMGDGSVQQLSTARLREQVQKASGQQRLLFPN